MASALLASRNEPHWGERKVYMRKIPNSNPNPNPRDKHAASVDRVGRFHPPEPEDLPLVAIGGAAVSDDSSSFNRRSGGLGRRRDSAGGYVTFNISAYSRRELRDLKRRLVSELEQVRSLASRIESREIQSSARSAGFSASGVYPVAGREVNSNHLTPPLDASTPRSDALGEKRTFQKVSGGNKAPLPVASPREPKRLAVAEPEAEKLRVAMMKKCGQVLAKVMKHKKCHWFNSPVNVEKLCLHDYHQIIKRPMDLGTAKSNLAKGLYTSPAEFAADVRLTFNNALLYNPEGHEVHKLAGQFLRHFESLYGPAYEKYEKQQNDIAREEERQRASSRSRLTLTESAMIPEPPAPVIPSPSLALVPAPAPPSLAVMPPVQAQQQQQQHPVVGRTLVGKQPKPKAKDPNKRPMSFEEKQKLSLGLQSLPQEKMAQVLQIVRKRNMDPAQHGDEIELDIEMMDTETLWELDRFVCNCKKMMSKIRRQEAMATNAISSFPPAPAPASRQAEGGDKSPLSGETPEAATPKKSKKGEAGEEDVDIGDEMPSANCPSLVIEKDAGYSSSGSSSGSDSSSSSGSDSESSSGSDSDEDEAPPAAVG